MAGISEAKKKKSGKQHIDTNTLSPNKHTHLQYTKNDNVQASDGNAV